MRVRRLHGQGRGYKWINEIPADNLLICGISKMGKPVWNMRDKCMLRNGGACPGEDGRMEALIADSAACRKKGCGLICRFRHRK